MMNLSVLLLTFGQQALSLEGVAGYFYLFYGVFFFPPAILAGAGFPLDTSSTWYDLAVFASNIVIFGSYIAFIVQLKQIPRPALYLISLLILLMSILGVRGCVPMVPTNLG